MWAAGGGGGGGGGGGEKRELTHRHSKPNTSVSRREIILTACRWIVGWTPGLLFVTVTRQIDR